MSDATKCGACGHSETSERDVDIPGDEVDDDGSHYVTAWQTVCEGCRAAGPLCESIESAVAAWDAMWAGRAGEATKWLMAGIADHLEGRDDDDPEAHFAVWHRISEARAALAELGIATSPDGGDVSTRSP